VTINRLDTNGYWMVGNTHIYIPSTPCKVEHSNITGSSTGRDEAGYMHIDWRRRDVRKVFLKYNAITGSELDWLMGLMQGKEFRFTFLEDNYTYTMNAYVGECSYEALSYGVGDKLYINFSINVIEK